MSGLLSGRMLKVVFVLGVLLYALAFQGSRGLWDPDEGRYSNVALEMLHTHDWLRPVLHPEHPHYTKPPLTYWVIAVSLKTFGRNEWAVRLPYALAFGCTIFLMYGLGRHFHPQRPWLPALVYATSLMPFAAANIVTTDTLLVLWETLAVFGFVQAYMSSSYSKAWLLLMWLGFGLAFLTKGPPGLLPLLAITLFLFLRRDWRRLRRLFLPSGLVIFALSGLSWYLALVWQTPHLLQYFLQYEVVDRVMTDVHGRHGEWYGGLQIYLPTLLLGSLPWLLLAITPLYRVFTSGGGGIRARLQQLAPHWQLVLAWLLVPLIVFMLARSRLPLYVLPLFAPLALLLAKLIPSSLFEQPRRAWTAIIALVLLLLMIKGYVAHIDYGKDARALASVIAAETRGPYDELVFVDQKPRYGLNLYLDAEIERICINACEELGLTQDEVLDQELIVREGRRLFLVPMEEKRAFLKHMQRLHITGRILGEVQDMLLVEIP